jgi:hypothetical protein
MPRKVAQDPCGHVRLAEAMTRAGWHHHGQLVQPGTAAAHEVRAARGDAASTPGTGAVRFCVPVITGGLASETVHARSQ